MKKGGGRNKGAAAERDVVNILKKHGFKDAHRTAPMQAGHAKSYCDIGGIPGYAIEVKAHKKVNLLAEARKYLDNKFNPENVPLLIWKNNRGPWFVCVSMLGVNAFMHKTLSITENRNLSTQCAKALRTDGIDAVCFDSEGWLYYCFSLDYFCLWCTPKGDK